MTEVAALKEQQLKLQQAQDIIDKQQAGIDDLEEAMKQLKIEQREQGASHSQVTEALVNSKQEAKQAAAQVRVNSFALQRCCHCL